MLTSFPLMSHLRWTSSADVEQLRLIQSPILYLDLPPVMMGASLALSIALPDDPKISGCDVMPDNFGKKRRDMS